MSTINIKFPLQDDRNKNGLFAMNIVTKEALSSNLMLLLLTDKGERYYHPNYGTNIRKFIFEPNDGITTSLVEKDIKDTVKNFIPELTITSVDFFTNEIDDIGQSIGDNEIRVVIKFSYSDNVFSEGGKLELSFKA